MSNLARVLRLKDGDVFHVWTVKRNFEYESNKFYEVEDNGINELGSTIWKRTGVVLNSSEVNDLYKNITQ
jgi:hypothetical protein